MGSEEGGKTGAFRAAPTLNQGWINKAGLKRQRNGAPGLAIKCGPIQSGRSGKGTRILMQCVLIGDAGIHFARGH